MAAGRILPPIMLAANMTPANIPPTWSAIGAFPETDAADLHWEIWNEFIEIGSEVKLT